MPKIVIANEGTNPPSEGAGKSVLYTKNDGLYVVLESGTVVGPLAGPLSMAGGALTGTYPNPGLANNAVTTTKIANGAVTGAKIDPTLIDPVAGTAGLRTLGTGAQQAAAGNDPRLSDSRAPSGAASGDLAGSYPAPVVGRLRGRLVSTAVPALNDVLAWNGTAWTPTAGGGGGGIAALTGDVTASGSGSVPATIANLAVTAAKIANATITDAQVAAANIDGAAATASMRTLGTSATQACAGNDSRLSDSRSPSGSATGDLSGSYPSPTVAQLQGRAVSASAPSNGQVLVWDGSSWTPLPDRSEFRFIVGNTTSPGDPNVAVTSGSFRYYPDSGDGVQLRAAIAAANSFTGGLASVYVLPGTYTLGDGGTSTAPITLRVPLVGAGPGKTIIGTVGSGGTPYGCVFRIDQRASIQDLTITTSSGAAYLGTDKAVVEILSPFDLVQIKNVAVSFTNGVSSCSSVFYVEGDDYRNTLAYFDSCVISHQSVPAGSSTFRIKGASASITRCKSKGWFSASSQFITCVSAERLYSASTPITDEPSVWLMLNQNNFLEYGYGVNLAAESVHNLLMSDNYINAFYEGVSSKSDDCAGFAVTNNNIEVRVSFNLPPGSIPRYGAIAGLGIQNYGKVGQIVGNSVYAATGIDTLTGTGPKKGHTIGLNTINYSATAISSVGGTDQVANNVTYL